MWSMSSKQSIYDLFLIDTHFDSIKQNNQFYFWVRYQCISCFEKKCNYYPLSTTRHLMVNYVKAHFVFQKNELVTLVVKVLLLQQKE